MATKGMVIWNKSASLPHSRHGKFPNCQKPTMVPVTFPVYILRLMVATSANFISGVDFGIAWTCILAKSPWILIERNRFSPCKIFELRSSSRHFREALAENHFCLVDNCCIRNLGIQRNFDYFQDESDPLAWYALPSNTINPPSINQASQLPDLRV